MEYLQVTIKNAKRDDKGIIWRCRVQKSLTETRSSPAFFQCVCECSFPSAIPGSRCIKPRCCCWTRASPVPILGLPSQSHHGHWAAQSHSHFLLFSEPSTSSEVFKFSLHCSRCKCPLSRLSRMHFLEVREVGSGSPGCTTGCEPQPIDLMWVTWERGSSIANARANHSGTILHVFIASFIYVSQKPCLQHWKWISLSLPALPRRQRRLQCIYGLNYNLHRFKNAILGINGFLLKKEYCS